MSHLHAVCIEYHSDARKKGREEKKKTSRLFDQNHEASDVELDWTAFVPRKPNQKSEIKNQDSIVNI